MMTMFRRKSTVTSRVVSDEDDVTNAPDKDSTEWNDDVMSDEDEGVTDIDSQEDDDVTSDIDADVSGDFWSEGDNGSDSDEGDSDVDSSASSDDVSLFSSIEDRDVMVGGVCESSCSADAKCAGFPEAQCVRDPCTCREMFVDLSGSEVNCAGECQQTILQIHMYICFMILQ